MECIAMKKPVRSAKDKADKPAAAGKSRASVPKGKGKGTASRDEVRQELRRTQVPRQSQRPAERSGQRRSGKPAKP
jgi:hypothetical protein